MHLRGFVVSATCLVAACGRIGFDESSSFSLRVTIESPQPLEVVQLDATIEFATVDPHQIFVLPPAVPETVDVEIQPGAGELTINVEAVDPAGRRYRAAGTAVIDDTNEVTVVIADLPATCFDGVRSGDESGLDCGGSCGKCPIGTTCNTDSDCGIGVCVALGTCEPASSSWTTLADMPAPRLGMGVAVGPDRRIYVYGGAPMDSAPRAEAFAYDVLADSWSVEPAMMAPRERGAGFARNGEVFALGGLSTATTLATVESFAPGASAWAPRASMSGPRLSFGVAVDANFVYAIGGIVGATVLSINEAFDGTTWTTRAPLPFARSNLATATTRDGRIVAVGGRQGGNVMFFNDADVYDSATNMWTALPGLTLARSDLAAATGSDGRIYVVGGFIGAAGLVTVEALRPGASAWLAASSVVVPRDTASLVLGPDGRLFVIGGKSDITTHTAVEAYGPIITVAARSTAPDRTIGIAGAKFAANAEVRIGFDDVPIALFETDASGGLPADAVVHIPATASPGSHNITAADRRTAYPVRTPIVVE